MYLITGVAIVVFLLLLYAVRILKEYERGVIFRLGRFSSIKGPGLIFLIPFIDKMIKVGMRIITLDVPSQDVITKDNVSVKVNAVTYFRVVDAAKSVIAIQNYLYATSQIAQTTLRSVLGEYELDDLLTKREIINERLQKIIDEVTDPWGIKVTMVEIKHVDLPEEMQRAIARQAEAERERRAKIIHAEGEFQAAKKLGEAAQVLSKNPSALHLRYLQTLTEISIEKNSTIIFPVPMDLIEPFLKKLKKQKR